MTSTSPTIFGFMGCAHFGYAPRNPRIHNGFPIRETDGYLARDQMIEQMIAAGVQVAIDGGDLFHVPNTTNAAIWHALDDDRILRDAGIETFYNSGNHDVAVGRGYTPTMLMAGKDRNGVCVGLETGRGPKEGRYEKVRFGDITFHVVSHEGLSIVAQGQDPFTLEPEPDTFNVLIAHGAFSAEGDLYGAAEPHGDEYPIPEEWANMMDASILSHFHQMQQVKWEGKPVYWTGSSLRRGYSDPESPRGWIKVTVQNGKLVVKSQKIWQRAQSILSPIDAATMSPLEVVRQIQDNLAAVNWVDKKSLELTGTGAPIVRQDLFNVAPATRGILQAHAAAIETSASQAAEWHLVVNGVEKDTAKLGESVREQIQALRTPVDQFDTMLEPLSDMISKTAPPDVVEAAVKSARSRIVKATS